jgi:predicted transcriptional regulator
MKIKEFYQLAEKKEKEHKDKDRTILLDNLTPIYKTMIESLGDIEKHIIYALIIRPKRVVKDNLAKKDLSNNLTIKDLSGELNIESKKLSVYTKRLVDLGLINRKKINKKDYEYNIVDQLFIDWFLFRNKINKSA